MKKLLLTTILVSAFGAAPVLAQTTDPAAPADGVTMPDIMAPEGFARQDVVLTAADLLGATIYDANGNSIGDVHDLVIDASGVAGTAPSGTGTDTTTGTGLSPDSPGGSTGAMPDADSGTGAASDEMSTDGTVTDGTTVPTPSPDADSGSTGTGMPSDDPAAGSEATGTGTAPDAGTAKDGMAGDSTATDGSVADGAATDGTASDGTTTGESVTDRTSDGMAADGTATTGTAGTGAASPANGQITHAVLDIGGFLGLGEHRVAVPISDLAIYRSDNETRVYLPWTQEQLEALPEYDENDSGTLGRSTLPVAD